MEAIANFSTHSYEGCLTSKRHNQGNTSRFTLSLMVVLKITLNTKWNSVFQDKGIGDIFIQIMIQLYTFETCCAYLA